MTPRQAQLMAAARLISLRTRWPARAPLVGRFHSVFRGAGMEFAEVREYQPGDDLRALDWNVTARTGRPHLKLFLEERELTVCILVDGSSSGLALSRSYYERARDVLALVGLSAALAGDRVGGLLFTDRVESTFEPAASVAAVWRMVETVPDSPAVGRGTDLELALRFALRSLRRRALVFLISDLATHLPEVVARACGARHDCVLLQLMDSRDEPPAVGLVPFRDPESGQERWLDLSSAAVRAQWQRIQERRDARTFEWARRCKLDLLRLTGKGELAAVRAFLAHRGMRGRR